MKLFVIIVLALFVAAVAMSNHPTESMKGGEIVLGVLAAYFLPTIVAYYRCHPSKLAILVVNIFAPLTVIGWFWPLVWALTGDSRRRV